MLGGANPIPGWNIAARSNGQTILPNYPRNYKRARRNYHWTIILLCFLLFLLRCFLCFYCAATKLIWFKIDILTPFQFMDHLKVYLNIFEYYVTNFLILQCPNLVFIVEFLLRNRHGFNLKIIFSKKLSTVVLKLII